MDGGECQREGEQRAGGERSRRRESHLVLPATVRDLQSSHRAVHAVKRDGSVRHDATSYEQRMRRDESVAGSGVDLGMAHAQPAPVKSTIDAAALDAIDIRVGTIQAVSDVARSRKLVKLTVDFGSFSRQILAGLKTERADVYEIEGRQALFVVNLAPREMAGEISEGMLFDIGYADGLTPVLAVPERPVPNGVRAG